MLVMVDRFCFVFSCPASGLTDIRRITNLFIRFVIAERALRMTLELVLHKTHRAGGSHQSV